MHNPLRSKPAVVIPDRPTLTKAQKTAIWNREHGLCVLCLKPVPPAGPDVQYDHAIPRELLGEAADDLRNIFATHVKCHSAKTIGEDVPRITKAHRQEKLTRAKIRKPGGFRKHPTLKRNMAGQVVPR